MACGNLGYLQLGMAGLGLEAEACTSLFGSDASLTHILCLLLPSMGTAAVSSCIAVPSLNFDDSLPAALPAMALHELHRSGSQASHHPLECTQDDED